MFENRGSISITPLLGMHYWWKQITKCSQKLLFWGLHINEIGGKAWLKCLFLIPEDQLWVKHQPSHKLNHTHNQRSKDTILTLSWKNHWLTRPLLLCLVLDQIKFDVLLMIKQAFFLLYESTKTVVRLGYVKYGICLRPNSQSFQAFALKYKVKLYIWCLKKL